jgi:lipopolysaccharide export system protein LptA
MRYVAAILFTALLVLPCAAPAADAGRNVSTRINASHMRYDAEKRRVVFEGNVHVQRFDFEWWAAKLTGFLEQAGGAGQEGKETEGGLGAMGMGGGTITRIVAEKSVRIRQESRTGTCGKATYTASDGKFVMEQDPRIVDGANSLQGLVIHFYTREGRSEVLGQVQAAFTTVDSKTQNATQTSRNATRPAETVDEALP